MEKQRGFPETVARKATDEDMDGARATLRVLARSHVAKGGSLPFWLKCNAPFMPQAAEPQELAMPLALGPLASPMPLDLRPQALRAICGVTKLQFHFITFIFLLLARTSPKLLPLL